MTDDRRRSPLYSYATLGLVMLFWSGNFIVGRAVSGDIPPFTLAFVRWAGAGLVLAPFAWRHLWADRALLRARWRIVLLLGITGVAAFNGFAYIGLRYTTASNGLLLQAAIPALVLMFDWIFFRQRSRALQVVAVLLSMAGVLLIVLRGHPLAILSIGFNRGDLLILCGIVSWAIYTSLLRLRPASHPLSFLLLCFMIGVAAMGPLAAFEWWQGARVALGWKTIGAFAYVALLPSLAAYILFNAAVQDIGAGPAGQTSSLMPLFGAFLAAGLLGEPLYAYHVAGMVLILGGIVLGAWMVRAPAGDQRPGRE
jgi:drug/metabolite transporter (DMT)-like permease